ncbi:MAG: sugar phosphate nucleotidyltransferase [Crocinitomicaceae bacterium]|nr:sugar phosphate nucleotidyltransferase [Crocinitomicaceae bacterium]
MNDDIERHLIHHSSNIKEAMFLLNKLAMDAILFVIDDKRNLKGSLTDGDIRRGMLNGASLETKVNNIIHQEPKFTRFNSENIKELIELREKNFKIIPVLESDSDKIIDIINFRTQKSYLPIDVVIMAGGRGSRLWPLTKETPKPLLKINNKAVIDYSVERLRKFGITNFHITVNYLKEKIRNHFSTYNDSACFNFIEEDKPLGTIGVLHQEIEFKSESILLLNGDLISEIDFEKFYLDFKLKDADISVLTIPWKVDVPYGIIESTDGLVSRLKEKPTYTYYANGGAYLIKKEILKHLPKDTFFNATDFINLMMKKNKKVVSFPFKGYWLDIGSHEDFKRAQEEVNFN